MAGAAPESNILHQRILMNPNQTGFMASRYIRDNIRIMENSMHLFQKEYTEGLRLSEWNLIFAALKRFGFGDGLSRVIKLLFKDFQTCVINPGSILFRLKRHPSGVFSFSLPIYPSSRDFSLYDQKQLHKGSGSGGQPPETDPICRRLYSPSEEPMLSMSSGHPC